LGYSGSLFWENVVIEMLKTYQSECEYCPNEVEIPLRVGPWQGWLPAETFLCDECFEFLHEED